VKTYTDRPPSAQQHILRSAHGAAGVFDDGVDGEGGEGHGSEGLEDGALGHDEPVVIGEGDRRGAAGGSGRGRRRGDIAGDHAFHDVQLGRRATIGRAGIPVILAGGRDGAAVPQVGLVALVQDIAGEVGPGDGVGGADEDGVGDGAEGLADLGAVGDVAVGGEEDGADAVEVGEVAVGGFGGSDGAGGGSADRQIGRPEAY
jgi:hypothetical protein